MSAPNHDGADDLAVVRVDRHRPGGPGWYVRRISTGKFVSVPFETRDEAERCLAVLTEVAD